MLYLDQLPDPNLPPTAVTIGVFDGVHRGHQALLAEACTAAQEQGIISAALTFDPHPSAVFSPARTPELLGTLSERADRLHEYGVEAVIVARFDREFAAQTPDAFIQEVLRDRLRAQVVVVGDDFRFGCNRTGDINELRAAGDRFGFMVRVVPPVFIGGTPARSTTVRQLLVGGKVVEAADLLGRPYALSGVVVRGRQLGRTIGFPTANLQTEPGILVPATGIYAAGATLEDGRKIRAAVSIGTNPTVTPEATTRTVEAYLMEGFSEDIYDQRLTLHFSHFLRPMLKLDSLEALIERMHSDVAQANHLLGAV